MQFRGAYTAIRGIQGRGQTNELIKSRQTYEEREWRLDNTMRQTDPLPREGGGGRGEVPAWHAGSPRLGACICIRISAEDAIFRRLECIFVDHKRSNFGQAGAITGPWGILGDWNPPLWIQPRSVTDASDSGVYRGWWSRWMQDSFMGTIYGLWELFTVAGWTVLVNGLLKDCCCLMWNSVYR